MTRGFGGFSPGEPGRLSPLALADFPLHPLGHSPGGQWTSGSRSGKKPNGGKIRADGPHWDRHSGCPRDSVRLRASEGKKRILSWAPGYVFGREPRGLVGNRFKLTTLEQFCLWSNEMEKIFSFPFIRSFAHLISDIQSGSV